MRPAISVPSSIESQQFKKENVTVFTTLSCLRVAHEEENQMDEHNLSIIFGPSLLGNFPDKANLLVDLPIQNTAIEKIITNYRTIFK